MAKNMNISIVGFEYTSFDAKKKSLVQGSIQIKNGISIVSVESANMSFINKESRVLKIGFKFIVNYGSFADINIGGSIFALFDKKSADAVEKKWKDSKHLDESILQIVLNQVMQKCSIEAISLSQKLNLPSPVPLPKVNVEKRPATEDKKEGSQKSTKKATKKN